MVGRRLGPFGVQRPETVKVGGEKYLVRAPHVGRGRRGTRTRERLGPQPAPAVRRLGRGLAETTTMAATGMPSRVAHGAVDRPRGVDASSFETGHH